MTMPAPLPSAKPGFTTSEFWTTAFVHVLALVAVLLDAFKVNWPQMDAAQAAIPVAALLVSALAQGLHSWHRSRVKITAADNATKLAVARLRPAVGGLVTDLKPCLRWPRRSTPKSRPSSRPPQRPWTQPPRPSPKPAALR